MSLAKSHQFETSDRLIHDFIKEKLEQWALTTLCTQGDSEISIAKRNVLL